MFILILEPRLEQEVTGKYLSSKVSELPFCTENSELYKFYSVLVLTGRKNLNVPNFVIFMALF